MRVVFLALLLAFLLGGSAKPLLAQSIAEAPELLTSTIDDEEEAIEDALFDLLIEEPKLCCQALSIDLASVKTITALLFWSRIRILCPGLRPTAIC